jgi:hypothetical protein
VGASLCDLVLPQVDESLGWREVRLALNLGGSRLARLRGVSAGGVTVDLLFLLVKFLAGVGCFLALVESFFRCGFGEGAGLLAA